MSDLQTPRAIVAPDKPCTSATASTSKPKKVRLLQAFVSHHVQCKVTLSPVIVLSNYIVDYCCLTLACSCHIPLFQCPFSVQRELLSILPFLLNACVSSSPRRRSDDLCCGTGSTVSLGSCEGSSPLVVSLARHTKSSIAHQVPKKAGEHSPKMIPHRYVR